MVDIIGIGIGGVVFAVAIVLFIGGLMAIFKFFKEKNKPVETTPGDDAEAPPKN